MINIQFGPRTQKTHLSKTVKKKSVIQTLRVKGFLKGFSSKNSHVFQRHASVHFCQGVFHLKLTGGATWERWFTLLGCKNQISYRGGPLGQKSTLLAQFNTLNFIYYTDWKKISAHLMYLIFKFYALSLTTYTWLFSFHYQCKLYLIQR